MPEPTGRAFVVRPFGKKSNGPGDAPLDFEVVHEKLIKKALDKVGLTGGTTGEFIQQGNIHTDMFRELLAADLVIADISIHNANAFYELGIRHALRDKYTVLIKADKRGDPHVFDLKPERYFSYDPDKPQNSVDDLVKTIRATLVDEKNNSPVFQLLPGLTSFDPSKVIVVPLLIREAVSENDQDGDALVALRREVAGQAWETEGLRLIGRALFKLRKHDAASEVWERIRQFDLYDVEANHRLATCYQKLEKFRLSEHAADRALGSNRLSDWDSAETYALIGSNHKTAWHRTVLEEAKPEKRQPRALTSPLLEQALDSYCRGFERHRSHYYSGINAVALLSIQVKLAELVSDRWNLLFDDEEAANQRLKRKKIYLQKLIAATDLAIDSSCRNYPDDVWAPNSRADLTLLIADDPERVRIGYERCIDIPDFNKESLGRQLKIYQDLELFKDNVAAALEVFPA